MNDFSSTNIVDCLRHFSETLPGYPAMEDGGRVIRYRELDLRTDDAAVNISAAGILAGDIVTIILRDSIEHLIVICGLARAGAVIFSLNPALTKKEIAESMAEIGSRILVTDNGSFAISGINTISKKDICAANGRSFGNPGACGDQPFVLIQSSGTTGRPKSFILSHTDSMRQCQKALYSQKIIQSDRFVSSPKMCFHFSRSFFLQMLNTGATIVLAHDLSPRDFCEFINNEKISYLKLIASQVVGFLDYAKEDEVLFPNLRMLSSHSAPLAPEARRLARKRLNSNFFDGYGSNEMGTVTFSSPQDQDLYPDSVGRPRDDVEAQIVDAGDHPLPCGEVGQARFRSASMVRSYLDNPEMNARHFRDGWFYPGDVAKINDDGYLFLLGRADDVINNSGIKFYPVEVENVLLSHPDVAEAAVFPWPHKLAGRVAGAAVVAEGNVTYKQLKDYCAERLAPYKVPYVIGFTKTLPRNAMGKVLKRKLAAKLRTQMQAQPAGPDNH